MTITYFTSDHHFGHSNIIDFELRPFENIDHMNTEMISRWNNTVRKQDIVYHAGDFSFLNKEDTTKIFDKLNGRIRLIMGNHDRARSVSWWKSVGFEEVYEYPICYKDFYWVSHEPMYMNKHIPYVNMHGHTHGTKIEGKSFINLCVEHWEYTPVKFDPLQIKPT